MIRDSISIISAATYTDDVLIVKQILSNILGYEDLNKDNHKGAIPQKPKSPALTFTAQVSQSLSDLLIS